MAFRGLSTSALARFSAALLVYAGLSVAVTGCATAPAGPAALAGGATPTAAGVGIAHNPTLTAVTTRNAVKGAQSKPWFGSQRASQASSVRIQLSSPHDGGAFSLAAVGLGDWSVKAVEPIPIGESIVAGAGRRDVLVYVHGFNQTFETAALDAARLSDGVKFRGDTMLFSWPSKNSVFNYIYDRESALWSRDALERMLDQLIADPSIGKINLVAHSMGTMLTVEVLRQIYDLRGPSVNSRFGAIILASPDIDMDGFTSSIRRIGGLSRNITVLTVSTDRALSAMSNMAGGITRVGMAEKAQLESLGLRVIDASQYASGGLNHDLFLSNGQVRQVIQRVIAEGGSPAYAGGE